MTMRTEETLGTISYWDDSLKDLVEALQKCQEGYKGDGNLQVEIEDGYEGTRHLRVYVDRDCTEEEKTAEKDRIRARDMKQLKELREKYPKEDT